MRQIQMTCLRSGQPRAYADSYYEYDIQFQHTVQAGPDKGKLTADSAVTKEQATAIVRQLCNYPAEPKWYETRHSTTNQIAPGRFTVLFVREYLD